MTTTRERTPLDDPAATRDVKPRGESALTQAVIDARFHDVALAVLAGRRSLAEICEVVALSRAQLQSLLREHAARFEAIYLAARGEFYGRLAEITRDERATSMQRDAALAARARTVAARLIDEVDRRLTDGPTTMSAGELRAAAATYASVVDRAEPSRRDGSRGTSVTVNVAPFAPTVGQVATIVEAFREAAIDLGDLDGVVVDAVVVDDGRKDDSANGDAP